MVDHRSRRVRLDAAHSLIDAAPAQYSAPAGDLQPLPPHLVKMVADLAPAETSDGRKSRLLIANLAQASLFTLHRRPGDDSPAGFEVRVYLASAVPGLQSVVAVQGAYAALVWQVADMLAMGQHQQAAKWVRAAHPQVSKQEGSR